MKTIETSVRITPEGQLILDTPLDVSPGEYQVVLVIEEQVLPVKRPPLELPTIDVGPWPEGLSLRREDMYDDDGR